MNLKFYFFYFEYRFHCIFFKEKSVRKLKNELNNKKNRKICFFSKFKFVSQMKVQAKLGFKYRLPVGALTLDFYD